MAGWSTILLLPWTQTTAPPNTGAPYPGGGATCWPWWGPWCPPWCWTWFPNRLPRFIGAAPGPLSRFTRLLNKIFLDQSIECNQDLTCVYWGLVSRLTMVTRGTRRSHGDTRPGYRGTPAGRLHSRSGRQGWAATAWTRHHSSWDCQLSTQLSLITSRSPGAGGLHIAVLVRDRHRLGRPIPGGVSGRPDTGVTVVFTCLYVSNIGVSWLNLIVRVLQYELMLPSGWK